MKGLINPGTHTTNGTWGRIISECLKDAGINAREIFAQAELDYDQATAPDCRIPDEKLRRLYPICQAITDTDDFSFLLGKYVKSHSFHALGMGVLSSNTLADAVERICRYSAIISDSGHFEITNQEEFLRFEVTIYRDINDERLVPPVAIESLLIGMLGMLREISSNDDINPIAVNLCTPRPKNLYTYQHYFRCPVNFGCEKESLILHRRDIERPVRYANEPLAKESDNITEKIIRNMSVSFTDRIYTQILHDLPEGNLSATQLASKLNMSTRKLQAKLQQQGTCYQELLDQARQQLAKKYLANSQYSLADISDCLGFANTSGFCRAFKRWFNQSPSTYRDNLAEPKEDKNQ